MQQNWQLPAEIKLIPTEPTPPKLFVYRAKIKSETGIAFKTAFDTGIGLPGEIEDIYSKHLVYANDLSEKNLYWEAGPAADFTEVFNVFATDTLEDAQKLMHDDPLYQAGIFYDDKSFEWNMHSPSWKESEANVARRSGAKPIIPSIYPPGVNPPVIEVKVEVITPPRLFITTSKWNSEPLKNYQSGKSAAPAFLVQHRIYRGGEGGMAPMGYDWESGPSIDQSYDITILSVNSLEMAKFLRENEPYAQYGVNYDIEYCEWCIHMPLRKASPKHKETLKRFLKNAGVKFTEE